MASSVKIESLGIFIARTRRYTDACRTPVFHHDVRMRESTLQLITCRGWLQGHVTWLFVKSKQDWMGVPLQEGKSVGQAVILSLRCLVCISKYWVPSLFRVYPQLEKLYVIFWTRTHYVRPKWSRAKRLIIIWESCCHSERAATWRYSWGQYLSTPHCDHYKDLETHSKISAACNDIKTEKLMVLILKSF